MSIDPRYDSDALNMEIDDLLKDVADLRNERDRLAYLLREKNAEIHSWELMATIAEQLLAKPMGRNDQYYKNDKASYDRFFELWRARRML